MGFAEILDAVDGLPFAQQREISEILNNRVRELRRDEIANHAKGAMQEYKAGKLKPMSAEEIVKEAMS